MKSSPIVIAALLSVTMAIRMHDADEFPVSQALVASNIDIGAEGLKDSSDSYDDKEIPVSNLAQTYAFEKRDIIDEDGDGVEDNQKKTQGELDRFRKKVFDPIEEMHNTHNGEYPGHVRAGESPMPTPPPATEVELQYKSNESLDEVDEYMPLAPKLQPSPPVPEVKPAALVTKPQENSAKKEDSDVNLGLLEQTEPIDFTMFTNDAEYIQLSSTINDQFSFLVNNIQSPEDLQFLQTQKTRKAWRRRELDADGDGIEDIEKFSHDELDEFYEPLVFGVAEDINNTHHGQLPGHKQLEFSLNQGEPEAHWFEKVNGVQDTQ